MPLYEYRCASCGQVFEVMQKFADEPLKVHESCGGAVERLFSTPSFQFKGSGFYATDYARAGAGKPKGDGNGESGTKPEAKKETKSESKAESKSESKPESKSESKTEPSTKPATKTG